jgi:hypothetical protein
LAQAQAAGGHLVGEPKIIARMLVAILSDGSAKVAMPADLDSQFALIGRALTAAILQAIPQAPQVNEQETPKELATSTGEFVGEGEISE